MWRMRQFARYLAYHIVWLSGISMLNVVVVILFRYHSGNCNCAIVVLFMTRGYDTYSFFLRMTDFAFTSRIFYNIKRLFKPRQKKLKGPKLVRKNSSETTLFRTKYTGGLQKLGNQDITGVFQSLTVKFILDSLITLTLFQCRQIADSENGEQSDGV
mmetsp:Transcript_5323/g.9767  ORF Transcript_5323/g.9767 Transcript_5323/m.9767 type:complete len:157 (-) Transcript_5323:973-1443(-)